MMSHDHIVVTKYNTFRMREIFVDGEINVVDIHMKSHDQVTWLVMYYHVISHLSESGTWLGLVVSIH